MQRCEILVTPDINNEKVGIRTVTEFEHIESIVKAFGNKYDVYIRQYDEEDDDIGRMD